MRRGVKRALIGVTALCAVSALVAGTWWAATAFVSPAQRDAAAAPPDPLPVMAPTERGALIDERIAPAQIRAKRELTVPLLGPSDADRSVLTSVAAAAGSAVNIGDSPASINGQPLLVLRADFPMYRDLGPGDRGPDVEALQQNLLELGLLASVDGVYGPATTRAVTEMYRRLGESPQTRPVDVPEVEGEPAVEPPLEPYLPAWATISVPEVPAIVASAPPVGATIGEATAFSFRSQSVEVVATIPESASADVTPQAPAVVTIAGNAPVPGQVATVSSLTTDGETVTSAVIELDDPTLITADLVGQNASVVVTVRVLADDALIVPLLAVADRGDGTGTVQVMDREANAFVAVNVDIIATLNGRVAISGGVIQEGTEVRVG